MGRVSVYFTIG